MSLINDSRQWTIQTNWLSIISISHAAFCGSKQFCDGVEPFDSLIHSKLCRFRMGLIHIQTISRCPGASSKLMPEDYPFMQQLIHWTIREANITQITELPSAKCTYYANKVADTPSHRLNHLIPAQQSQVARLSECLPDRHVQQSHNSLYSSSLINILN